MIASPPGPKIALLGFMLETNGFAPPAGEAEFREKLWLEGEGLLADVRAEHGRDTGGTKGFVQAMDARGPWRPVPLLVTSAGASGPAEQDFFTRFLALIEHGLHAALPLDGVYIEAHGAASATAEDDPEGTLFARVRTIVGPEVPIVATLDLHANVSRRMVEASDLLISYLTNPHVDMAARGAEAARAMGELLAGTRIAKAFVKVPLLPPSVALLTARGPYAEVVAEGQRRVGGPVLNVSILGNFSQADSPKNGMSVIVTTRGDQDRADQTAKELAATLWAKRDRLVANLTSIPAAVQRMCALCADPSLPSLLFADVADNPGGGGRGNTTDILKAFLDAGISGSAFAIHYDPPLAAEAHRLGVGARFTARLNRAETEPTSRKLSVPAQIVALSEGCFVGRRGSYAGRLVELGPTARLRLDGRIEAVFVSIRQQCSEPMMLEHLGIDLTRLRGLVVKSRGHFRAGFDDIWPDERIVELDGAGLVSPVLTRLPWRRVARPIWPLDPDLDWTVPEAVAV